MKNRRLFFSLWFLGLWLVLSLTAELICNDKPYFLKFRGKTYFPLFKDYSAEEFGDLVRTVPSYRELVHSAEFLESDSWALFPLIPFGENESMKNLSAPPPTPPSRQNWLGTDDRGRDLLTRLLYGFRNSFLFSLCGTFFIVVVASLFGSLQGYLGGRFDFLAQRFTEVWSALPVLYVIIFLVSLFPASSGLLLVAWVSFSWIALSTYIRAEVLKVKNQEYIVAARALGASFPRLLLKHILPNGLTPILTYSPFILAGGIGSLAALDYLGLGLAPPTASWGELLKQGKENLASWWLVFFPFFSLFLCLLSLNFIGEEIRKSLNVREHV